ncbi:MAG: oxygenase MpaB family protein [Acidovorax sp.]
MTTLSASLDAPLQDMRRRADPLGDHTIAKILGDWPQQGWPGDGAPQWKRIAEVNRLLRQWTDNASLSHWQAPTTVLGEEAAQALTDYVRQAQALPPWADLQKIQRAERLFMEHGALSCILLFCSSLPECYVLPDLADVLHTAGQLEQHTEYRIRSTAAMIFPVMMRGGMEAPDGAGIAQTLKVRLIHSTIRNLILRGAPPETLQAQQRELSPLALSAAQPTLYQALFARGWDTSECGLPCNQEEQAYTLLTFSYVFLRSLRRLGIGLPQADEEAYLHAWNVVGHVLGIERGLMADTMDQAAGLFARMQARGRSESVTPDPRPDLAAALMQTMAQSIPWPVVKPIPVPFTRYLCGRATARDLGLGQQVPLASTALFWTVLLLARGIDTVARWVFPHFSLSRMLTRILGYRFISQVLMSQTRPLQLPEGLLHQVDSMVNGWSYDPEAPAWVNWLEDRMTTRGSWIQGLARARTSARP